MKSNVNFLYICIEHIYIYIYIPSISLSCAMEYIKIVQIRGYIIIVSHWNVNLLMLSLICLPYFDDYILGRYNKNHNYTRLMFRDI